MSDQQNTLIEKTTVVKNNDTLKLNASPFAKGYRLEITLAINPDNPIDLDKVMLEHESSALRQAVKGFSDFVKSPIEEGGLGGHIITDD